MTRGLGHTPATTTGALFQKSSVDNSDVDLSRREAQALALVLSSDAGLSHRQAQAMARIIASRPAPSPELQSMIADSVSRARASIAEREKDAEGDPQGRQAAQLGSGGATVPRSGGVDHTLPRQVESSYSLSGSSTINRWALLHKIQKISRPADPDQRGPAVCGCGMPAHDANSVNIHLRTAQGTGEIRPGVSGIYRCGSPWLCPTCATKKAFDRAERVQDAANATFQRGGRAALVVLTAAHSIEMSLSEIKALVATSSSAARKGRAWVQATKEFGILGVIVGQEVTYSTVNGWHYHQHLSVMVDGPGEGAYDRAKAAGEWIAAAYTTQVRARGGTVSDRHGWHVRVARDAEDASDYTAKGSMAWEVSGGHKDETKSKTSLTPWDIAAAAADGNAAMYGRWREYMETMPGTRSCVVSAALAAKLGIGAAGDDDEGGEQALHDADEVVGRVDAPMWRKWMRHSLASTFLARVALGGEEGFKDAVDDTERDAAPLEAEYQRMRAERAAVREEELRQKTRQAQLQREAARSVRDTAFAQAYAIDRLRRFADCYGSRNRIARVIAEAAAVFPHAHPLNPADLYKVA